MFKILYQNIKQGFHFKSTANSHFSDFITFLFAASQEEKKNATLYRQSLSSSIIGTGIHLY